MGKTVDYYFSPISPWTYLGHARFADMAKRYGAVVNVKPADFGKVFPVSGGLPLAKRAPQRQAYRMVELKRFRDHLKLPLNLQPKFFPAPADLAAQSEAVKAEYEGYAQEAVARHVFGAPSYVIDGEIFWGQDRLEFVERALAG